MAKARRYYYECVYPCDLGYIAPDQRRERWVRTGRSEQAKPTLHCHRMKPSPGYNARGDELPPDYIVTDQPIGRQYTEEIAKRVSRPDVDHPGQRLRVMREKTSKIKFRLLDPDEVTDYARRSAYDYGMPQFGVDAKGKRIQMTGWHESLFQDVTESVTLGADEMAMAKAGRKVLLAGKEA